MSNAPSLKVPIIALQRDKCPPAVAKFQLKWNREATKRELPYRIYCYLAAVHGRKKFPSVSMTGFNTIETMTLVKGSVHGDPNAPKPMGAASLDGSVPVRELRQGSKGPEFVALKQPESDVTMHLAGEPADFVPENVAAAVANIFARRGVVLPFEVK
jgi:hypothetical protein